MVRSPPWQSAPRKPSRSGWSATQARHVARLQRAGKADDQPLSLGGGDAIGEPHEGHMLRQRPGALAHRVEHHAMRADPGGERDGIEFGQGVGEQDENEAQFAGVARKPLEAAFRIAAGEDARA